jgi:nucleotidyltransferase/DNA polymerase involved in DNA repair
MARGIDERPVITEHERKSIGAETTFARDLPDGVDLRRALKGLATRMVERMQRTGAPARTVVLKLRYADFHTITRQVTLPVPTLEEAVIVDTATSLLDAAVKPGDEFRLIGVSCGQFTEVPSAEGAASTLQLWPDSPGA